MKLILICSIMILIIIFFLCRKRSVAGVWIATQEFTKMASISSAMLYLDDSSPIRGYLIMNDNNNTVIVNQPIKITKGFFSGIHIEFTEDIDIPSDLDMHLSESTGELTFSKDGVVYLKFVKDHESTNQLNTIPQ